MNRIHIRESEIQLSAVRAQGAGGQNVNKVANAVHLRFDIRGSSRITRTGVVVIKAQQHRSLEMNRAEALERLHALVEAAAAVPKRRKPTRPTRGSQERRIQSKLHHSRLKALRARILD